MEEGIDAGEAPWRAGHAVVGGGEAVDELVPGGRAGKDELYEDADKVHVAKGGAPEVKDRL